MTIVTVTHRGWLGLCPIYCTLHDEPYVVPTHWILQPWLVLNIGAIMLFAWLLNDDRGFPIQVDSELTAPIKFERDDFNNVEL